MSDTPKTDAATIKGCGLMVRPDFARALERECYTLKAEIRDAVAILKSELDRDEDPKDTLRILVVVAVNSLARLKAENEKLRKLNEPVMG